MKSQSSSKRTKHELRCICTHEPLLAVYGLDEHGELYIHVKIYKGGRLYAELVITEGKVQIHCRDCARWHKITILVSGQARLEEDRRPVVLGHGL